MMKKKSYSRRSAVIFVAVWSIFAASAQGDLTYWDVTIDVSGISSDLELEFDLFDNAGAAGDTYVLVDNLKLANSGVIELVDFEDFTLQGFDTSLNPDSVGVVSGSLNGTGSYLLRIDDLYSPTITWRDFINPGAMSLSFDFFFQSAGETGFWGPDELVVSLLDTAANPLVAGLTGSGDILRYNAIDGIDYSSEVSAILIPAPGALLLGLIGMGTLGLWRKFADR